MESGPAGRLPVEKCGWTYCAVPANLTTLLHEFVSAQTHSRHCMGVRMFGSAQYPDRGVLYK